MDGSTLRTLFKRPRKPLIFAPLGNGPFLKSAGADDIHIMDWWDSKRVEIQIPREPPTNASSKPSSKEPIPSYTLSFDITCTPCQHFSGRKVFDDFQTLWCSWAIEATVPSDPSPALAPISEAKGDLTLDEKAAATKPEEETPRDSLKVYFAGDTGYRSVRDDEDEAKVPTCPVFKEIGEVFGGFDFAMIPIGWVESAFSAFGFKLNVLM
jgi:N-acyl-phosphatidylethanolamine-hydrolysing phospholipase D